MPLKTLLRRKSKNRRESKIVPHAVDECEILSKPFPKLETRITSPTELINLVGHPDLSSTIPQKPALLKTTSTANTEQFHDYLIQHRTGVVPRQQLHRTITFDTTNNSNNNSNNLNTMINNYNNNNNNNSSNHPISIINNTNTNNTNNIKPNTSFSQKNTDNEKTLISQQQQHPSHSYTITSYSEYTDHKIYNHRFKQRSSPCLKRQYDQDQTTIELQELRRQIELLEKEQAFWHQKIHDQQKRESELIHLLETTLDNLNQQLAISSSTPSSSTSSSIYHHHYIHGHPSSSSSLKRKQPPLRRTKSMDRSLPPPSIQLQNKNITNIIQHNHQPIYEDYILPPWPPFVYL